MLIDAHTLNRRDTTSLALHLAALPIYDTDREWLQDDIHNAMSELFPCTEQFGWGHVSHAASAHAMHLADVAASYWQEYQDVSERVEKLKRDYRNTAHDPVVRYHLWCDLGWAREYRDRLKACALDTVRRLMQIDSEAFITAL